MTKKTKKTGPDCINRDRLNELIQEVIDDLGDFKKEIEIMKLNALIQYEKRKKKPGHEKRIAEYVKAIMKLNGQDN